MLGDLILLDLSRCDPGDPFRLLARARRGNSVAGRNRAVGEGPEGAVQGIDTVNAQIEASLLMALPGVLLLFALAQ